MCAINGIIDVRGRSIPERVKDEDLVRRMNQTTIHRGPDGSAHWSDTFATLASNRLAIIDLSKKANQPITSASGRYTIVFNGEIYNYRELRKELSSYPYVTEGDTEAILASYEKWGKECFSHLRGMFAIAIWDSETKELILARDQSGIKPLYYRRTPGRLVFSSELKGLLTDKLIDRKINREALDAYLHLRYVPEPLSMIEGIYKLSPGSYAVLRGDEFITKQYFNAPLSPQLQDSRENILTQIETLIDQSVKAELVSDRPIGLFLSGGLDSNILLDSATKAGGPVETFSLRFDVTDEEDPAKFNSDADLALLSAEHYKSNHHEILLNEETFVKLLPDAMYYLDQPIANPTAVAQLYLSREARKHIVVALTGDGGDELFGGYPRYGYSILMDLYQSLPSWVRTILNVIPRVKKLDTPEGIERIEQFLFEKDRMLSRVISEGYLSHKPAEEFEHKYLFARKEKDFIQLFMDADRRSWLIDEALARTDTMTMAASLEARVPLLNTDLVLFASRIPSDLRVQYFKSKQLLKDAFRKRLPQHILEAPKRGWFSPTAKWLRHPGALALAKDALSPGFHIGTDALLNFEGAEKMLNDHVGFKGYALPTLWTLITLRLWAKAFDAHL